MTPFIRTPEKAKIELAPDRERFCLSSFISIISSNKKSALKLESPSSGIYSEWITALGQTGAQIFESPTDNQDIKKETSYSNADQTQWSFKGIGLKEAPQLKQNFFISTFFCADSLLLTLYLFHYARLPLAQKDKNDKSIHWDRFLDTLPWSCTLEEHDGNLFFIRGDLKTLSTEEENPDKINSKLLQSILSSSNFEVTRTHVYRDGFAKILSSFGYPIQIFTTGNEPRDELEKRIFKIRGLKVTRKHHLQLNFDSNEIFKPKNPKSIRTGVDPLYYGLYILIHLSSLKKEIRIQNCLVSSDRSGLLKSFKKMGLNIELLSKKDSGGESYADLKIKKTKDLELKGRKYESDFLKTCLDEWILVVLACTLSVEESILKDFPVGTLYGEKRLEHLRKLILESGCDMGQYPEGWVLRGREELAKTNSVNSDDKALNLAIHVWNFFIKADTPEISDELISEFPFLLNL